MIKLEVAKYCQNCPMFVPEVVSRPEMETMTGYDAISGKTVKDTIFHGDTCIACKDRDKCTDIYKCISKTMEEEKQ